MKRFLLVFALLGGLACHRPAPEPRAARLTIHFLDQDAEVGLDHPLSGAWSFMDAGRWVSVDTIWNGGEGRAVIGRTAPKWVMLQDPEGGIHRVVLSDAPDTVRSQGPTDREDAQDQAEGLLVVWLWLSHVIVDH